MVVSLEGLKRMFTYKFKGLKREDASTPYYYGSLPTVPKIGHILTLDETGNRYRVDRIVGEGLKGKGGRNVEAKQSPKNDARDKRREAKDKAICRGNWGNCCHHRAILHWHR